MDRADLRQVNPSGSVDTVIGAEVDLSPDTYTEFVSRADNVIGRDWNHIQRGECRGDPAEEICAIDGQDLTGGGGDEFLEFGERFGREDILLRLRAARGLTSQVFVVSVVKEGRLLGGVGLARLKPGISRRKRSLVLALCSAL
jgi:hypothetical protein